MELQNAHQSHCAQEQQNTISARETPEEDEVNCKMHDDPSLAMGKDMVEHWKILRHMTKNKEACIGLTATMNVWRTMMRNELAFCGSFGV